MFTPKITLFVDLTDHSLYVMINIGTEHLKCVLEMLKSGG